MATFTARLVFAMFLVTSAVIILYHQSHVSILKPHNAMIAHPVVPPTMDLMLLFLILFLAFVLHVLHSIFNIATNYCAAVIVLGLLLGIWCYHNETLQYACRIVKLPELEILFVYIPIALFNISFCLDVFLLVKTLPQVLVIGIFVGLSTAVVFGIVAKYIINSTWLTTFGVFFGILCLPVYPKSITALLKQQSTRTRQISVLLEGEALMTFVIVDITRKLVLSNVAGLIVHWYQFVAVSARHILLGSLTGYLSGILSRYILKKMFSQKVSIFTLCFAMPLLTYALSETYISGCGSVSVVILGAMLGLERSVLRRNIEKFLEVFWDLAGFALDAVVCFLSAMEVGANVLGFIELNDYVRVFGIYLSYYIVRLGCFLFFSPIISRLGYGMDIKNMIVCVWCGLKSPYSLQIVGALKNLNFDEDVASDFYFYITGLYFISTIINGTFTNTIMDFLDLTHISTSRRMNMNNCIKHLFRKRERTIAVLKMDRLLVDSNWPKVLEATSIKHPYKIDLDENDENNFLYGYRFTYCEECKKDVPIEPTQKEFREMTREARLRIFKAKKMSYSRQYQNGMISTAAIRMLSQVLELGMDSKNVEIDLGDLYNKFLKESCFQRIIRKRAERLRKKRITIKPPMTYWRRKCYHLVVTSRLFAKIMLLVVLLNVCGTIVDIYSPPNHIFNVGMFIAKGVFLTIYIMEFIIKILAYSWKHVCQHGFRTYFKSFWNIQDFIMIIISVMSVSKAYLKIARPEPDYERIHDNSISYVEGLELTRALRLLRVFEIFYPDIITCLEQSVDKKMSFTYELGKSYATAETEIVDMLPLMIDNKEIRESEQRKMEIKKVYITKLIGMVQKERPWIAITVKTQQAIKSILNAMNEALKSLKMTGWVDGYEDDKLNASMNELYKKVASIKKVQPSPPKVIFKEVAWMAEDEAVIDFLFENVTAKKFEPGEVVFGEGTVADGIYIVVTGLFMISYTPDLNIQVNLTECGRLPVVDYSSGTQYDEPAVDFIVSGNCIGELSTLTGRGYNSVISAEAHSQVYVLSRGVLNRAMELSPDPVTGLQCRIWKEIGIRIAISLLLATPAYQALSQDQVKIALERAFVPELKRFKIFEVTDLIEDIVLIEGVVSDFNTRTVYTAPCYIPRTVQKIILPTSSLMRLPFEIETKLLIIPAKDVDEYDVMMVAEETCELVPIGSSTHCLQHIAQRRLKGRTKRSFITGAGVSVRRRGLKSGRTTAASSLRGSGPSGHSFFKEQKSEIVSIYMPLDDMDKVSQVNLQGSRINVMPTKND